VAWTHPPTELLPGGALLPRCFCSRCQRRQHGFNVTHSGAALQPPFNFPSLVVRHDPSNVLCLRSIWLKAEVSAVVRNCLSIHLKPPIGKGRSKGHGGPRG